MIRNSKWLILSRLVKISKGSWIVYVALVAMLSSSSGILENILKIFFVYYTWTRIYVIFYDYLSWRYKISKNGIFFKRGIFSSNSVFVEWKNIRSLTVEQDVILRKFDRKKINLNTFSDSSFPLVIYAASSNELKRIKECIEFQHSEDIENHVTRTVSPSISNKKEILSLYSKPNFLGYLIIGITHAQFVVALPILYSFFISYYSFTAGSSGVYSILSKFVNLGLLQQILTIAIIILSSVVMGTLLAWVKFHHVNTSSVDGNYIYTHGLLNKKENYIQKMNIEVIHIQQNILMRLFKVNQLSVVTGGNSLEQGKMTLLPVANSVRISDFISEVTNTCPEIKIEKTVSSGIRVATIFLLALPLTILLLVVPIYLKGFIILFVALLYRVIILLNSECGTSADEAWIIVNQGFLLKRKTYLRVDKIHMKKCSAPFFGLVYLFSYYYRSSGSRKMSIFYDNARYVL